MAKRLTHRSAKPTFTGSNPVLDSLIYPSHTTYSLLYCGPQIRYEFESDARVAELVDALVLGTSEATRGGSSPLARTKVYKQNLPFEWKVLFILVSSALGGDLVKGIGFCLFFYLSGYFVDVLAMSFSVVDFKL